MRKVVLLILLVSTSFICFSQDVFDIGIRKIEIFFSQTNWDDSLDLYYANNLGERLIADSVIIDGEVDQDVGIKYKGNSSYNANNAKNPINIKLDEVHNGQSIDGYNVLKLSNGFKDPTLTREVLAYEIAREYMPASKATYANVFINTNLIGIYTIVQSIDADFTNEHFYERKGPFFKGDETQVQVSGCPSGPLGIWQHFSDTNCYKRVYEMLSTDDWEQLGNFMDTVNNYFSVVEDVLDIDRTLWMMAFENLIVSLDAPINGIVRNFYMFKDNNGRFSPIIWDNNEAFGTFTGGLPPPVSNTSLQNFDPFHGSTNNQNIMTTKVFGEDQYKRMYVAHMRTIIDEYFTNNDYYNRIVQLQQIVDAAVVADPNYLFPYTDFQSNVNNSVGNVIGITELMNARVMYLQSLPEFTAIPPSISGVSSTPTSVLPHTTISITASVSNSNYAYLGYRFKFSDQFEKIEMFDDGNHGDGTAGDGVFGATINVDARDVQYYIYAENANAGVFSPERAEHEFHQLAVVSGLVINEIMAANFSEVADQDGEYDDWVEIYNRNSFSLNLNGYFLSDNENDLTRWTFPNTTILANDYLIVWCDTAGGTQTGLHTTYRLSADQEEVYLTDPSGIVIDAVHFVNMPTDIGYARIPNGTGVMTHQTQTYDANNQTISAINNIALHTNMRVYPNPSNTRIYILGATTTVDIFNMMGQKIYSKNKVTSIDISAWECGIYFVKSGNRVVKILKQ